MLGDRYQLAENLWFIAGKMPADAMQEAESANAVYYRAGDHGYLIDSGVGKVMRTSILRTIVDAGPLHTFTLLNSHGHAKYQPLRPSPTTIEPYEGLPRRELTLGGQEWRGWTLGDGEVWVLEERGHSPDEVLIYIPEHHFLHAGDLTMALFPTWPDSDERRTREMLGRLLTLARNDHVCLLSDGNSHTGYRGDGVARLLQTVLDDHERFRALLAQILRARQGLTIGQIYEALSRENDPVVEKYRALEFPHTPPPLQNVILALLLEIGYEVRGPEGNKRFYLPATGAGGRAGSMGISQTKEVINE